MRSITTRLLLAFLGISIFTALLVVVLTRRSADREFNQFLVTTDQHAIAEVFQAFYHEHGSWDGLAAAAPSLLSGLKVESDERGALPFTLTDSRFRVILPGGMYQPGDVLLTLDQPRSLALEVDGRTVGYLDMRVPIPMPEPSRTQFMERMTWNLAWIGLAAILAAVMLAFLVSHYITRPIRTLTAAAREVSEGNLSLQVPVRSRDEIGRLAEVFNTMIARLDTLQKARKQMTADIAHELRTPISIILGHAEGMHDGVIPSSPEKIEVIRSEAVRLERLVNDLRVLALSDAGELTLHLAPVQLSGLLRQALERFELASVRQGVDLRLEEPAAELQARLDPERMLQVLGNLLDNALRHTPRGGQVVLAASRTAAGQIALTVADSGEGIAEEDLERVFERLYRADWARGRAAGGSGLGLALARSLVEQQGGHIRAERRPGGGTRMVITLPYSE